MAAQSGDNDFIPSQNGDAHWPLPYPTDEQMHIAPQDMNKWLRPDDFGG